MTLPRRFPPSGDAGLRLPGLAAARGRRDRRRTNHHRHDCRPGGRYPGAAHPRRHGDDHELRRRARGSRRASRPDASGPVPARRSLPAGTYIVEAAMAGLPRPRLRTDVQRSAVAIASSSRSSCCSWAGRAKPLTCVPTRPSSRRRRRAFRRSYLVNSRACRSRRTTSSSFWPSCLA